MVLIPKEDKKTVDRFKKLINAVAKEKWGDNLPKQLKISFRDGDKDGKGGVPDGTEAGSEPYGGNFFLSARSNKKPGIVDADMQEVIDSGLIESGDYGCVSFNCFAFDNKHGKGVSFGLGNVQFIKKGERLGGGGVAPDKEFTPIAEAAGVSDDSATDPEGEDGGIFNV